MTLFTRQLVDFAFRSRRNSSSTISLLHGYLHHNRISSQTKRSALRLSKSFQFLKAASNAFVVHVISVQLDHRYNDIIGHLQMHHQYHTSNILNLFLEPGMSLSVLLGS